MSWDPVKDREERRRRAAANANTPSHNSTIASHNTPSTVPVAIPGSMPPTTNFGGFRGLPIRQNNASRNGQCTRQEPPQAEESNTEDKPKGGAKQSGFPKRKYHEDQAKNQPRNLSQHYPYLMTLASLKSENTSYNENPKADESESESSWVLAERVESPAPESDAGSETFSSVSGNIDAKASETDQSRQENNDAQNADGRTQQEDMDRQFALESDMAAHRMILEELQQLSVVHERLEEFVDEQLMAVYRDQCKADAQKYLDAAERNVKTKGRWDSWERDDYFGISYNGEMGFYLQDMLPGLISYHRSDPNYRSAFLPHPELPPSTNSPVRLPITSEPSVRPQSSYIPDEVREYCRRQTKRQVKPGDGKTMTFKELSRKFATSETRPSLDEATRQDLYSYLSSPTNSTSLSLHSPPMTAAQQTAAVYMRTASDGNPSRNTFQGLFPGVDSRSMHMHIDHTPVGYSDLRSQVQSESSRRTAPPQSLETRGPLYQGAVTAQRYVNNTLLYQDSTIPQGHENRRIWFQGPVANVEARPSPSYVPNTGSHPSTASATSRIEISNFIPTSPAVTTTETAQLPRQAIRSNVIPTNTTSKVPAIQASQRIWFRSATDSITKCPYQQIPEDHYNPVQQAVQGQFPLSGIQQSYYIAQENVYPPAETSMAGPSTRTPMHSTPESRRPQDPSNMGQPRNWRQPVTRAPTPTNFFPEDFEPSTFGTVMQPPRPSVENDQEYNNALEALFAAMERMEN